VRRVVIIASIASLVSAAAFGGYLWSLYGQLRDAFNQTEQFIPTRIFSDVTRVANLDPRQKIESRLRSLGYLQGGASVSTQDTADITFQLHPISYPSYLIPEGHPTFDAVNRTVRLKFSSNAADAPLQSIDVEGREIQELFLEPEIVATLSRAGKKDEVRELVFWKGQDENEIPPLVWKAITAVEDQHFEEHMGLDPRGIARAIWVNLKTFSFAQGGSTITQQLVKNLMARRTKNIFRKVNEIFLALLLEARFSKEQILERYLNEVYLGQIGNLEVHGVAEGAKHFFGKRLRELNLAEIALMAGLIRGPGYYSPYRFRDRALERQRLVLRKMVETGQIAEGEAEEALKLPIRLAPPQMTANKAPYFADFVKAELIRKLKERMTEQEITQAGFRVYTTLDPILNSSAQRAVAAGITDLEKRFKIASPDRLEGALAAVDHTNGFIRALVGGRSYAQSTFNRILNMRRQVGSTFKPLVYLAAMERGEDANGIYYGPSHPAEDGPWKLTFDRGRQTWSPKNYEKEFRSWLTYRDALAHSINTVAARLGFEIGIENVIKLSRAIGIESELLPVPSLSLGVAELSPIELLRVYATFANHGVQHEFTVIRGITKDDGTDYARFVHHPRDVIAPGPADLLTDMLQSVFSEGTAHSAARMGFVRPAAGKTGTTSNHRDSWFAGYTPQLTAVVWVGMDQARFGEEGPEPAKEGESDRSRRKVVLTGGTSALPIWVGFMNDALRGEPLQPFPVSPHLVTALIDSRTGKLAKSDCPASQTRLEKFVRGHEPKEETCEMLWPVSVTETVGQ